MKNKKYGYKGSETAINGITNKLEKLGLIKFKKDINSFYKDVNEIMSSFLFYKNIAHWTKGHSPIIADHNAKIVQKYYKEFIEFLKIGFKCK